MTSAMVRCEAPIRRPIPAPTRSATPPTKPQNAASSTRRAYPATGGPSRCGAQELRLGQQTEVAGARGGLGARATGELAQDVPHVHVHGAAAEEQLLRHLRVRLALGEQADDLELTAGEPGVARVGLGA